MTPETFDRTRLSSREDAILEAAIEGMTDIQIAQKLDISQSTVNSYWVRIRGKLGQLSRTELVALALKAQAQSQMDVVNARLATLQAQAQTHARISADYERAEIFRAALDAAPEAVLVGCQEALIRYTNSRLEAMFGYEEGELTDRPITDLVQKSVREKELAQMKAYMKDPHPLRIGINSVVYGQQKNGTLFRVVLLIDSRPTSTGPIFTCVVRDFTSEIEMRRVHISAWS